MDKITVAFECPNCHVQKKLKKAPEMRTGKMKCPSCQTPVRLVFDIDANPQTATASIIQEQPKASQQQEASQPVKKATVYEETDSNSGNTSQFSEQQQRAPKKGGTVYADDDSLGPSGNVAKKKTVIVADIRQQQPMLNEAVYINRLGKRTKRIVEKYQIYEGSITIGRQDPIETSDIMFADDAEMSRQSVLLTVIPTHQGTVYRLKVLKATNPVIVGSHRPVHGEEVAVQPGEIIILGRTRLMITNK